MHRTRILIAASVLTRVAAPVRAQHGAVNGEWHYYGGDAGTTKRSGGLLKATADCLESSCWRHHRESGHP